MIGQYTSRCFVTLAAMLSSSPSLRITPMRKFAFSGRPRRRLRSCIRIALLRFSGESMSVIICSSEVS